MTNFKLGDWVRVTEGHAKNKIFKVTGLLGTDVLLGNCFNYKADHCELWTPEENEWCWFWCVPDFDAPILSRFCNMKDNLFTCTNSKQILFTHCEPFIGQLPTTIKDNT